MSHKFYKRLLNTLKEYEPKRLINNFYYLDNDYDTIGVYIKAHYPHISNEELNRMPVILQFFHPNIKHEMVELSDNFKGTPEERYNHIIQYLEKKVGKKPMEGISLKEVLVVLGMASFIITCLLIGIHKLSQHPDED